MSAIHQFIQGPGVMLDPFWDKVLFLFQNAGASGATSFVDRSKYGRTITAASVASTAINPRFGMNGAALAASPTFFVPASADLRIEGKQTTWEIVFSRPTSDARTLLILNGLTTGWSSTGTTFRLGLTASNAVQFDFWSGGASGTSVSSSATVTAGAINYVKVTYDQVSKALTVNANGTVITHTANGTMQVGNVGLGIGNSANGAASVSSPFNGTVYAVRVTSAIRPDWHGAYTLPFPAPSGTANSPPPPPAPESGQLVISGSSWTVPAGITEISAVCIGRRMKVNGTTVLQAQNGARIGDGGGEGGNPSAERSYVETTYSDAGGGSFGGGGSTAIHTTYYLHGGGGGAGGYGANGGNGGNPPQAGTLGAGSGGQGSTSYANSGITPATHGRGASLRGLAGGGTLYGGGWANGNVSDPTPSRRGNALAWKNAIAVNTGDTITFEDCGVAGATVGSRIIWGAGRSFPDNAGDV